MKKIFIVVVCVVLSSCCTVNDKDVSFKEMGERNGIIPPKSINSNYPGHFVACRADYSKSKEKKIVDNIVKKAISSNKDIVLYFHGGLSSQGYMDDKLGKKLMEKVFKQKDVDEKIYPIFVNYDAGILDLDSESVNVKSVIKDVRDQKIADAIKEIITDGDVKKFDSKEKSAGAADAIYRFAGKEKPVVKKVNGKEELSDDQIKYFTEILEAQELPSEFETNLKNKKAKSELTFLAGKVSSVVDQEYERQLKSPKVINQINNKNINKSAFNKQLAIALPTLELRILRILARMALSTDHGIDATIYEEILDSISIALGTWLGDPSFKIGRVHWDKVKRHSKQCFNEGSNGRVLIDSLFAQKADTVKINTLSHSAGAIPTAELIKYLSEDLDNSLTNVVMLVPAINQYVFSKFVIPADNAYEHLTVYSLKQDEERKDKVGATWIYPASLLYFVSANAEDKWHFDQMLLIEQHMKNKRPYNTVYKKLICEEPEKVWEYFDIIKGPGGTSNNKKATFTSYPFGKKEIAKDAATHEGTKYPWLAYDLARDYFKLFGVKNADQLKF